MVILPAVQDGAEPKAGSSAKQSACLRYAQGAKCEKGEKCNQFRPSLSFLALPPFPLVLPQAVPASCRDHASAWRLCGADRPASRHPIAAGLSRTRRGEAAPPAFLLTEPNSRREGRPSPRSRYGVSCTMRARTSVATLSAISRLVVTAVLVHGGQVASIEERAKPWGGFRSGGSWDLDLPGAGFPESLPAPL
jgi:hypothetical protein